MSRWTLIDAPAPPEPRGVHGYDVSDALGLPVGVVSGTVFAPDGAPAFLKITVRERPRARDFLVPLGLVGHIDARARRLRLRLITKTTLVRECVPVEGRLPGPHVLEALLAYFPPPRPGAVARVAASKEPSRPARIAPPRPPATRPRWVELGRLTPPAWKPLSLLSEGGGSV
ncbi:hypothetical protein [Rhodocaloribacter sp.]